MGLYIRSDSTFSVGMEMPSRCSECIFNTKKECKLCPGLLDVRDGKERRVYCPLVDVPDHGPLVDAALIDKHIEEVIEKLKKRLDRLDSDWDEANRDKYNKTLCVTEVFMDLRGYLNTMPVVIYPDRRSR